MIELPSGYRAAFPDMESTMVDLVRPWLAELRPTGYVCTWMPDDTSERANRGQAVVRVNRLPGQGITGTGVLDTGKVQIGVVAGTRADSWAVTEFLRSRLVECRHGVTVSHGDGSTTRLQSVSAETAPVQAVEVLPTERLTWATYEVVSRKYR